MSQRVVESSPLVRTFLFTWSCFRFLPAQSNLLNCLTSWTALSLSSSSLVASSSSSRCLGLEVSFRTSSCPPRFITRFLVKIYVIYQILGSYHEPSSSVESYLHADASSLNRRLTPRRAEKPSDDGDALHFPQDQYTFWLGVMGDEHGLTRWVGRCVALI
jgi:hypothetical protein